MSKEAKSFIAKPREKAVSSADRGLNKSQVCGNFIPDGVAQVHGKQGQSYVLRYTEVEHA